MKGVFGLEFQVMVRYYGAVKLEIWLVISPPSSGQRCSWFSFSMYRVQQALPREWCHPLWSHLPTSVNTVKMIIQNQATVQSDLDNSSLRLSSLIVMQLAYTPFRLDYQPYNSISYTYISL